MSPFEAGKIIRSGVPPMPLFVIFRSSLNPTRVDPPMPGFEEMEPPDQKVYVDLYDRIEDIDWRFICGLPVMVWADPGMDQRMEQAKPRMLAASPATISFSDSKNNLEFYRNGKQLI